MSFYQLFILLLAKFLIFFYNNLPFKLNMTFYNQKNRQSYLIILLFHKKLSCRKRKSTTTLAVFVQKIFQSISFISFCCFLCFVFAIKKEEKREMEEKIYKEKKTKKTSFMESRKEFFIPVLF